MESNTIYDILNVANEFRIEELVICLQTFLIEDRSSWLKSNFSNFYYTSFTNNFTQIQGFYNQIIAKRPNLIFEQDNFLTLSESALISLIRRDDLKLEEHRIWDHVVQWGIAQNNTIPSDVCEWTDEDFKTMEKTLQRCLPHIRYFQFPKENVEKLIPYEKIFKKSLWDDIIKYHVTGKSTISSTILPPRNIFRIISSIVTKEQATVIASWIDKKDQTYEVNDNPYEFELILSGKENGFAIKTFWDLCNRKANVVLIMKVKDTGEIIGGYNPIGWDSNLNGQYCETKDSFIFSLKNRNPVVSRVNDPIRAICNNLSYGSNFGNDLYMLGNGYFGISRAAGYKELVRKKHGSFMVDDYEVFRIWEREII